MFRLGGPVGGSVGDAAYGPEEWAIAHKKLGYSAAFCPDLDLRDAAEIAAFREAAKRADLVIAEVGAWSNPISADDRTRKTAIEKCIEKLALADAAGALCCVNIAGSRGDKWDGPHPHNFTDDTFLLIVDTVREIIDAVKPTNAFYTLEMMPWVFPDSADAYLALIRAVDRKAFAVHLDPVNIVSSPRRFYENGSLIRECFRKLGPYIKSCHAKDITLADGLTVHLSEMRPGLGALDYRIYLRELRRMGNPAGGIPLMLEHLPSMEEYRLAADYIRSVQIELE